MVLCIGDLGEIYSAEPLCGDLVCLVDTIGNNLEGIGSSVQEGNMICCLMVWIQRSVGCWLSMLHVRKELLILLPHEHGSMGISDS